VIPFMESPREQRTRRLRIVLASVAAVAALVITAAVVAASSDLSEWFR
jgi:hypothetical protein